MQQNTIASDSKVTKRRPRSEPLENDRAASLQRSIANGELDRACDTHDVAHLYGCAEITIQQQRARGEGPRFFRVGRSVRYRLGDVLAERDAKMAGKAR